MSSGSDSSGPSVNQFDPADAASLERLGERVMRKLSAPATEEMAVADHRKAVECMVKLRDALLDGVEPPKKMLMCLTCAGVSMQRRVAFQDSNSSILGTREQFTTTMALLYTLVVMCQPERPRPSGGDAPMLDADREEGEEGEEGSNPADDKDVRRAVSIAAWENGTVEADLRASGGADASSWNADVRSPGELCKHCLNETVRRSAEMTIGELANMGALFFRSSSAALATSMLDAAGLPNEDETPFLSLDVMQYVAHANNNIEERLMGIADCAESEAGQTVLRDLILSFKLPRGVVRVRRACLLSRDSNKAATEKYTYVLGVAHDAAMRGARWSYEKDADETHKMCSILAGLAVMMCKNAQSVRKDDMYYGRVTLPFLETTPPGPGVARMALIEHTHEWIVYSLGFNGQPIVHLRQRGYDGLCQAAVLFCSKIVT